MKATYRFCNLAFVSLKVRSCDDIDESVLILRKLINYRS